MTLVIARKDAGCIYMVGDTKLTPQNSGGRDGQLHYIGGLKIVILHPGTAIAFAHNTEMAAQAIQGIHSSGVDLFDSNEVLSFFLSHHERSRQREGDATVEFIAAFELSDRTSKLFVIKDGCVEDVDAGYIGNTEAYNCFLHHQYQLTSGLPARVPLAAAMQALDAVIRDPNPKFQGVDGFTIGLRQSVEDGFCYTEGVIVEGRPTPVRVGPMAPLTFGGAPDGSMAWTIGSSPGNRLGVLTAFCHTGAFGVIYRPALNFEPRIIRNCTNEVLMKESLVETTQIVEFLNRV